MMPGSDDDRARDPSRREFFRTFSRDAVRNVGAAVGAAAELRRSSAAAARELLELGTIAIEPQAGAERLAARAPIEEREPGPDEWTFRSPYRFAGDELVVLDQRELPGQVTTVACRAASQVASAIRAGALNRGPVLAEVAAYALVLAARESDGRPRQSLEQHFDAAANTLRTARNDVHALSYGIDRVEQRYRALTADEAPAAQVHEELRHAADEVAAEAAAGHAEIGRLGAAAIGELVDGGRTSVSESHEVVHLLMHGDMGPLSCGLVGTGTAVLMALIGAGRKVHVWLTDAAPGNEGARLGAFQLTQLDVPHTIISDSAVGWLLANRRVQAVLLRADAVCRNGDTGTIVGGLNVAQLAAAASVPVHSLAPRSAYDPRAADGSALRVELHSAAERLAAGSGDDRPAGLPSVIFGARLVPHSDVVPADLIERVLTEAG